MITFHFSAVERWESGRHKAALSRDAHGITQVEDQLSAVESIIDRLPYLLHSYRRSFNKLVSGICENAEVFNIEVRTCLQLNFSFPVLSKLSFFAEHFV